MWLRQQRRSTAMPDERAVAAGLFEIGNMQGWGETVRSACMFANSGFGRDCLDFRGFVIATAQHARRLHVQIGKQADCKGHIASTARRSKRPQSRISGVLKTSQRQPRFLKPRPAGPPDYVSQSDFRRFLPYQAVKAVPRHEPLLPTSNSLIFNHSPPGFGSSRISPGNSR